MKNKFKAAITSILATAIFGSFFISKFSPETVKAEQVTKKKVKSKSTHEKHKSTKTKKSSRDTLLSRAKKLKYGMSLTTVKRIMKVKPTEEKNEDGFVNLTYGNDKVILGFDEHNKLTSAPIGAPQIAKQGEKNTHQHTRNRN